MAAASLLLLSLLSAWLPTSNGQRSISPLSSPSAPSSKHPIYIGGFLPYDEPDLDRYESIKAASDIALRQINNSPHILRDYQLNIIWNDSKVAYCLVVLKCTV